MILNYKDLENNGLVFLKCGKYLSDYFVYTCHLPIYSIEGEEYIFLYNQELKNSVEKMDIFHSDVLFMEGYWEKIKDLPLR